jgi:membrane associated rhomboid family serine protease
MIPLKDDAPRVSTPWVTYTLIAANSFIYLLERIVRSHDPQAFERLMFQFGMVPAKIWVVLFNQGYVPLNQMYYLGRYVPAAAAFVPVLTSMFLHGSLWHVGFNMLALWIFGDNVEDYVGHFRYLILYLLSGLAATALHTFFNLHAVVPTVGASGAIAGIMGAYFVLYPRAKVLTLVPFFFVFFVWLPAWIVLGYFFLTQFLSGAATSIVSNTGASTGIAFWAHVGGFLGGMGLVKLFPARTRRYYYG